MVDINEREVLPHIIKDDIDDFLIENQTNFSEGVIVDMHGALHDKVEAWCEDNDIPFEAVSYQTKLVVTIEYDEVYGENPNG
jgi:hypothetical protein